MWAGKSIGLKGVERVEGGEVGRKKGEDVEVRSVGVS